MQRIPQQITSSVKRNIARFKKFAAVALNVDRMSENHRWLFYLTIFVSVAIGIADGLITLIAIALAVKITGPISLPPFIEQITGFFGLGETSGLSYFTVLSVIAVMIFRQILQGVGKSLYQITAARVVRDVRNRIIRNILAADFPYLKAYNSGSLRQSIVVESGRVMAAAQGLIGFISAAFLSAIMLWIIFQLSATLTLITIALAALLIPLRFYYMLVLHRLEQRSMDESRRLMAVIGEIASGITQIKLFGVADRMKKNADEASEGALSANRSSQLLQIWDTTFVHIGALIVGILLLFLNNVYQFVSLGLALGFLVALYRTIPSIADLSKSLNSIVSFEPQVAGAWSFYSLDSTYFERTNGADYRPTSVEEVEFENVSLSYDRKTEILSDVSLCARKGEVVAIVGPSGAGKSSLVHLMLGMYKASAGTIRINGRNIQDISLASLRSLVGIVTQDFHIFQMRVSDLIRFGATGLDDAKVLEAARNADAAGFIENLPKGFRTELTERGATLSGGQRQRLALAQLIARETPVLILDEATASVDTRTEERILAHLHKLKKDKVTFIITHRMTHLQAVDRIYVLADGKIVEEGKWEELLARRGTFWSLAQREKAISGNDIPFHAAN